MGMRGEGLDISVISNIKVVHHALYNCGTSIFI